MQIINCHIHTFRDVDVPDRFLPFALVRILRSAVGSRAVIWLLKHIIPFTNNDILDRYAKFVTIGKLGSQKKIFEECARFYPANTQFVVLAMDLSLMDAGPVKRPYGEQLAELSTLSKAAGRIFPFFHADPRREKVFELFKYAIEELGFRGLKIYPNIGYLPFHEYLYPIYEYCQANNLPVIAHGSPRNAVYYRGSRKEILKLLDGSLAPIETQGKTKKDLCAYFSHPLNYEKVVRDFPRLKYCLAHFGSEHQWREYIQNPGLPDNWFLHVKRLMGQYEHVYTDVSFTMNSRDLFPLLKITLNNDSVRQKVLFGSDFYLVETKANERRFGLDLRAFIGEEFFRDIAQSNPIRFLGIDT